MRCTEDFKYLIWSTENNVLSKMNLLLFMLHSVHLASTNQNLLIIYFILFLAVPSLWVTLVEIRQRWFPYSSMHLLVLPEHHPKTCMFYPYDLRVIPAYQLCSSKDHLEVHCLSYITDNDKKKKKTHTHTHWKHLVIWSSMHIILSLNNSLNQDLYNKSLIQF